jgi:Na+-transporting methylmalonyl-CoA/oxaloacetate decarboxylase gamma subunit
MQRSVAHSFTTFASTVLKALSGLLFVATIVVSLWVNHASHTNPTYGDPRAFYLFLGGLFLSFLVLAFGFALSLLAEMFDRLVPHEVATPDIAPKSERTADSYRQRLRAVNEQADLDTW